MKVLFHLECHLICARGLRHTVAPPASLSLAPFQTIIVFIRY